MYPHDRLSKFRSSFQFKLFKLFTLLTTATTILFGSLYVLTEIRENRRHATEQLQLLTDGLADTVRLPLYAENSDALLQSARDAQKLPEISGVEISAADGRVLIRLPAAFSGNAPRLIIATTEVRSSPNIPSPEAALESGHDYGQSLIGYVRLYRGTGDLYRAGRDLTVTVCAMGLLFLLLLSLSSYLLLRRVTSSFQDLLQGLHRVHAGDYSSRIAVISDDEPGRAAAAVNDLAESLRQREEENRHFNAERDRSRQELRNLLEHLPVGIIRSNTDGTIEYLNRFIIERFGYAPGEIRTIDDWFRHICPDNSSREQLSVERRKVIAACMAAENGISQYDVMAVCKDGSHRFLICGNQLSDERVIDILIDMTDREQLQQQLIRNQKLESIGVLAGGIAHNFNNALTGVMGFISYARKFLETSHSAHAHLVSAEKATKRASDLANQLLTFAKGSTPVKKPASITKLVDEAVALATCGSKVSCRLELPSSLHSVLADDCQISQAFTCICINAVQAMPDGGILSIRGRNVSTNNEKLPVPEEGAYVEISFGDQGCGILEQNLSKIFTPYFTTKATVGNGLGLATTYSIITRHGGAITFVSTVGSGTTFTVYLPSISVSSGQLSPEQITTDDQAATVSTGASLVVMDEEKTNRGVVVSGK